MLACPLMSLIQKKILCLIVFQSQAKRGHSSFPQSRYIYYTHLYKYRIPKCIMNIIHWLFYLFLFALLLFVRSKQLRSCRVVSFPNHTVPGSSPVQVLNLLFQ